MTDERSDTRQRSYVKRTGRVTPGQARALRTHWTKFGLSGDKPLNIQDNFGRVAPCFVEIGFGMGEGLAALAEQQPEHDFIGIEVHEAGIGRLLSILAQRSISNVRILRGDAVILLENCFGTAALAGVLLYFPDPWPKKRHHKRRLVQPDWVALMATKLAVGGQFRLATDWENYAQQMLSVIEAQGQFRNQAGPGQFMPDRGGRIKTKFEQRGERLGHKIYDLCFERT